MKRLFLALALLSTGVVRAQEEVPPPIIAPPPPQLWNSKIDFDKELAARAHRNKIAGGLLIGLGSAILAAGQAMTIYALSTPRDIYVIQPQLCSKDGCAGNDKRYDTGMIAGGAVMALAGAVMTLIGIPVYAVGGAQSEKAQHRLQLTASGMRLEF